MYIVKHRLKLTLGLLLLSLLLTQVVSTASAAKIVDQPPDKVSIAYDTNYTFMWKTDDAFKGADLQIILLLSTVHSECSVAEYKSTQSTSDQLKESRGDDLTYGSDMKSASINVTDLTYGIKPSADDATWGLGFNQSSTNRYLCYVYKFTATFSSSSDHVYTLVKVYKSNADIPAAEKVNSKTGYSVMWWIYVIGGSLLVLIWITTVMMNDKKNM